MPTTLEQLELEVLRLPPGARSHLLDRLIDRLDDGKAIDAAWESEAARRDAEGEDGTSQSIDGKEVVARLRAQIR